MIAVHLLRHGRVDSHRGDVPLSASAQDDIVRTAARLLPLIGDGERIEYLATRTRRARETAEGLRREFAAGGRGSLDAPIRDEGAIRNPDILLAGQRVEMVSSADAFAAQVPGLAPADVERVPFFRTFIGSGDRIGFWLAHGDPPGENADAVARRVMAYCRSLADVPSDAPRRMICVTHSPVLRAVLARYLLGADPGEPEFVEAIDLTVDRGTVSVAFRRDKTVIAA